MYFKSSINKFYFILYLVGLIAGAGPYDASAGGGLKPKNCPLLFDALSADDLIALKSFDRLAQNSAGADRVKLAALKTGAIYALSATGKNNRHSKLNPNAAASKETLLRMVEAGGKKTETT